MSQNKCTPENKKMIVNLKNDVPTVNLDFHFMCGHPKFCQWYKEAQWWMTIDASQHGFHTVLGCTCNCNTQLSLVFKAHR